MAEPVYDVDDARAVTDAVALILASQHDAAFLDSNFADAVGRVVNAPRQHVAYVVETLIGFIEAILETHPAGDQIAIFENLAVKAQRCAGILP